MADKVLVDFLAEKMKWVIKIGGVVVGAALVLTLLVIMARHIHSRKRSRKNRNQRAAHTKESLIKKISFVNREHFSALTGKDKAIAIKQYEQTLAKLPHRQLAADVRAHIKKSLIKKISFINRENFSALTGKDKAIAIKQYEQTLDTLPHHQLEADVRAHTKNENGRYMVEMAEASRKWHFLDKQ